MLIMTYAKLPATSYEHKQPRCFCQRLLSILAPSTAFPRPRTMSRVLLCIASYAKLTCSAVMSGQQ